MSIGGEISPVHAPESAQCMFCAPTFTRVAASACFTSRTEVKGGMTKGWMRASQSGRKAANSRENASASASVLCIFQLVPTQNFFTGPSSPP